MLYLINKAKDFLTAMLEEGKREEDREGGRKEERERRVRETEDYC